MTHAEWKVFLPVIGFLTVMLAFNMSALRVWGLSLRARPWFADWRSPSLALVARYFLSAAGLSLMTVMANLGAWALFASALSGQSFSVSSELVSEAGQVAVAYWVVLQMVWIPVVDRRAAQLFNRAA